MIRKEIIAKICFLFQGASRKDVLRDYKEGKVPDSPLFGYNHILSRDDIEASFIEFEKRTSQIKEKIRIFQELKHYDAVVSSVGIPFIIAQSFIFRRKPEWFLFNINLTTILRKHKNHPLRNFFLKYALNRAKGILCLSTHQKKFLEKEGIKSEKIHLLHFGVDKDFFRPEKDNAEGEKYFLSVGRDQGRDYKTLIDAARQMGKKLIIVASPKNMADLGGMPENIELRYDLSYQETRRLYQGAEAVLVITHGDDYEKGSDCSGQTTILDAMACGKVVIATKKSWIEDYFEEGKHILTVSPYDKEAIIKMTSFVSSHPDEVGGMGMLSRNLVEEKFNTEVMGNKIADIIKQSL